MLQPALIVLVGTLLLVLLLYLLALVIASYRKAMKVEVPVDDWYVRPWLSRMTPEQKARLTKGCMDGYTRIFFGFWDWVLESKEDLRYAGFRDRVTKTAKQSA